MRYWSTPPSVVAGPIPKLLLGVLAFLLMIPIAAGAQVVINEIMADPAGDWDADGSYDYRADEWIEVRNIGTDPVDLNDYWLRDGTGEDIHLRLFGTLAPDGVAVFYGSQALAWQLAEGLTQTGFSLNNGGDAVHLLQTIPETNPLELDLVDLATYGDHEAEDDRSSGLDLGAALWRLYDGLNAYGGDQLPGPTGCDPSPGEPNFCVPQVAVDELRFGTVKALYR